MAAILRFNHINQPFVDDFSWRESSVAMMAENFYRKNWNIFYPEVNWTGPGPSYQGREFQTVSYIAALLYTLVGQHDWIGRSVAVVFGLWGIFALYQLVRLVWDEKHAIVSAALMALLPGSIFIERSFLPDSAMVALVITSFWMLVAYLQTDCLRYLLLAGAVGTWGFLTKLPGLIIGIPMAYATFVILSRRQMLYSKKLIPIGIAAFLTIVPVTAYYLWARHLALSYPPYHFAGSGGWIWIDGLKKWWDQKYFLTGVIPILKSFWTLPIIYLAVFSLLFHPPRQEHNYKKSADNQVSVEDWIRVPWLFHWWILACVIYYLIGAKELWDNPWNFHIFDPLVAVLAGRALILLGSCTTQIVQSPASLSRIVALLLLLGWSGQKVLRMLYTPRGAPSYNLGVALRQITQPKDLVVTIATDIGDPVAIYYSQRRGWVFPPAKPAASGNFAWKQLPEDDNEGIRLFEELRHRGAGWLGIAHWMGIIDEHPNDFWQDHPKLVEYIKHTCELKSKSRDWIIYRILTPEEIARLDAQRMRRLISAYTSGSK